MMPLKQALIYYSLQENTSTVRRHNWLVARWSQQIQERHRISTGQSYIEDGCRADELFSSIEGLLRQRSFEKLPQRSCRIISRFPVILRKHSSHILDSDQNNIFTVIVKKKAVKSSSLYAKRMIQRYEVLSALVQFNVVYNEESILLEVLCSILLGYVIDQ